MKRFLLHTLLTITDLSGGSINAQECPNGWCEGGCVIANDCNFVKVLSRNYPYVNYLVISPNGSFKKQADCQQFKSRFIKYDGTKEPWDPTMQGSVAEEEINTVCGM